MSKIEGSNKAVSCWIMCSSRVGPWAACFRQFLQPYNGRRRSLRIMSDRRDMDRLKQEQVAKRTRWLVWAESLIILGLLVWVSVEYESNLFLESWAKANIGPISFLLNGTLAGIYAGLLSGYAIAKYAGKKTEEEKILESLRKSA